MQRSYKRGVLPKMKERKLRMVYNGKRRKTSGT